LNTKIKGHWKWDILSTNTKFKSQHDDIGAKPTPSWLENESKTNKRNNKKAKPKKENESIISLVKEKKLNF
jgi:hypothetical protein